MRDTLALNSEIDLQKNSGEHRLFTIEGIAGEGANFIVYDAYYLDEFRMKSHIRLKECFPLRYAQPHRAGNHIVWDNEEAKKQAFSDLEYVYKRQKHLQEQTHFVNTSSHIEDDIYYGNNTGYLTITRDVAQTFKDLEIKDLQSMLKILLHLSGTIGTYHSHGLLHLDLKPENFMVLDKTEEIKLIDFDSFISTEDVAQGILQNLSYTNSWAAPEVKQGKLHQIGRVSDVYSIGSILFYGLFRRPMEAGDILTLEALNLENHPLLENLNPAVQERLEHFLRKCLEPSVRLRYQNTEELCAELEKLIPLADPKALFLCSSIPEQLSYFMGRQKELSDVHELLQNHKMVLINGIGGIGKSEFSKYYTHNYRDYYRQVVWFKLESNIVDAFCDGKSITIANYDASGSDNSSEKKTFFTKKLQSLKSLVTKDTLFIIDDVRDFTDKDLLEVLKLDCKFLLTSRKNPRELFAKDKIYTLSSLHYSSLEAIFLHHYSLSLSKEEQELLPKLFEKIGNYTLLIPILAKLMQMRGWTPSRMLTKISDGGLTDASKDLVASLKDDEFVDTTMYLHVKRLFNLSELTSAQKKVLSILSWLENLSISRKQLQIWCGEEEDYSVTQTLIRDGWVQHEERLDLLSVHNVIGDVLNEEIKLNIDEIPVFKEYLLHKDFFSEGILIEKVLQHIPVTEDNFEVIYRLLCIANYSYLYSRFSKHAEWDTEKQLAIMEIQIGNYLSNSCHPCDELLDYHAFLEILNSTYTLTRQFTEWSMYKNFEDYWTKVLKLNIHHSALKDAIYNYGFDTSYPEAYQTICKIVKEIAANTQDFLSKKRIDYFLKYVKSSYYAEECYPFYFPITGDFTWEELEMMFDDLESEEQPDDFLLSSDEPESTSESSIDLQTFWDDLEKSRGQKQEFINSFFDFLQNHVEVEYTKNYLLLLYLDMCEKGVFGKISIANLADIKLEKLKLLYHFKSYRWFLREVKELTDILQNNSILELEHILHNSITQFGDRNLPAFSAFIFINFYQPIMEDEKNFYKYTLINMETYAKKLGCKELLYLIYEEQMKYNNKVFFNSKPEIEDKISMKCFTVLGEYIWEATKAKTKKQWKSLADKLTKETELDEQSMHILQETFTKEDAPRITTIENASYDSYVEQENVYNLRLDDISFMTITLDAELPFT